MGVESRSTDKEKSLLFRDLRPQKSRSFWTCERSDQEPLLNLKTEVDILHRNDVREQAKALRPLQDAIGNEFSSSSKEREEEKSMQVSCGPLAILKL